MNISRLEWQKLRLGFWTFYTLACVIYLTWTGCKYGVEWSTVAKFLWVFVGSYMVASAIVDLTQGYERGFFTDKRRIEK